MGFTITDGTGSGREAKVSAENRLSTDAVTIEEFKDQTRKGFAFVLSTGPKLLTGDGTESALLYIKNDSQTDLILNSLVVNTGASVGGAGGDVITRVYENVSGGTLITDEDPGNISNLNFGSSTLFNGTVYAGDEGSSVIGGVVSTGYSPSGFATAAVYDQFFAYLPQGVGLAVSLETPAGNTAMRASLSVNCYYTGEFI